MEVGPAVWGMGLQAVRLPLKKGVTHSPHDRLNKLYNEHDEGGWLQPTLGAVGKPNDARIKALEKVLRPAQVDAVPSKP